MMRQSLAREMPRVVRRGEESSSESEVDDDDDARDVATRGDAHARSRANDADDDASTNDGAAPAMNATASSTSPSAGSRGAERGIALSIIGHRDAPGADGDASGASARGRRRDAPNTKLVARVVKALNAAPIARADAVARARERDLAILSQTSASMTCVNTCAREASLSSRETRVALRALVAPRDASKHSDDAA